MVFTALALLLPTAALAQEPADNRGSQHGDRLPASTAEPDNAAAYAPPTPREEIGTTDEDLGPVQQRFVLAPRTDTLASEDDPPRVGHLPPEKMALDRRIHVSLVHDVEDGGDYRAGDNHALLFELKYINWGAVTQEQLRARQGHYFTISWSNHGPTADLTAVFQYRQVKSQGIVRTLEEPMPHVHGTVRSYFAVVGKPYFTDGPVASWRFTIRKGDTVVGETKSYLW